MPDQDGICGVMNLLLPAGILADCSLVVVSCCHSDVHVQKGDWASKAPLPIVLGHEGKAVPIHVSGT